MTACWRSFVWFIATVTSGAVNSMPTSAVKVSGTPWTWPEPTTVTSRGLSPTFAEWLSQADTGADRETQREDDTERQPGAGGDGHDSAP